MTMKSKLIPIIGLAFAVLIASACSGPAGVAKVQKPEIEGITNFSQISPENGIDGNPVGIGGATTATAMPFLKERGFDTVISLRLASEEDAGIDASRIAAEKAGLTYLHMPLDPKNTNPEEINQILSSIGAPDNQPVYLHCGSATRAAAIWMIYRVVVDEWSIEEAQVETKVIAKKPPDAISFATTYLSTQGK